MNSFFAAVLQSNNAPLVFFDATGQVVILVNCVDDLPECVVPGVIVVLPKTIDFFILLVTAVDATETKVCFLHFIFLVVVSYIINTIG